MAKVAIVGAGAWGTALACQAARMQHEVTLWAREREVVTEINAEHRNSVFLPDVTIPEAIRATDDPEAAVRGADLVVLVPPSQHLRPVALQVAPALSPRALVAVASKGIEESSGMLLSQVMAEVVPQLGSDRLAFLSGPSFAREVAEGLPTDIAAGSEDMLAARRVQPLLHAPTFRVYTSADPIGVQVGGAIKNVIAIAAGACDGLGLGANARASLITRGLAEITRLGVALGADPLTFLGLAGVGDLVLTCTGDLSRNRTLGHKVAEGVDPKSWLESRRSVAEGFYTADAAHALARKLGLDMPITEQVYHVLHKGRPLKEAIMLLLSRGSKDELQGIRAAE